MQSCKHDLHTSLLIIRLTNVDQSKSNSSAWLNFKPGLDKVGLNVSLRMGSYKFIVILSCNYSLHSRHLNRESSLTTFVDSDNFKHQNRPLSYSRKDQALFLYIFTQEVQSSTPTDSITIVHI